MDKLDDMELLREYVRTSSEAAFAQIASRYVNLVYSAALRQVTNPQLAEEVTQAVFIILAQKAGKLNDRNILVGWLFQTTRYAASDAIKREMRRQRREQEAAQMESLLQTATENEPLWDTIAPSLDEALSQLSSKDRDAVLLRFFENKNLNEVGSSLGISEEAARKRVDRAVEKLRTTFVRRGVTFSIVGLTGLISANAVQAAPLSVASTVTLATKGTFVAASTSTLVKGTIKTLAWVKLRTAIILGTVAAIAMGTAAVIVKDTPNQNATYDLRPHPHFGVTPVIANAVYEIEANPNMISSAWKHPVDMVKPRTYVLRKDGENYVLSSPTDNSSLQNGNYSGTAWYKDKSRLLLFNTEWNPGKENGGVPLMQSSLKRGAHHLTKWGISALGEGGIIWGGEASLGSRFLDDKKVGWVDFDVENGVAISATLRHGKGGPAIQFITYQYDPAFYEGKLPKGYVLYWGNSPDEKKRMHTMRIRELELSDTPLPRSELDPAQLFPSTLTWFYTNNVAYIKFENGKIIRMPTGGGSSGAK